MQQPNQTAAHSGEVTQPRLALVLDGDLFFAVKVASTLTHAGFAAQTVRRLDAFTTALAAQRPAVALVNTAARALDWRAAIVAARAANVPVVAYGAHVDLAAQDAARQAGATAIIANSKLASDLPAVVARALRRAARAATGTEQTAVSAPDTLAAERARDAQ
ncbi:MAG: hypothetical protein ACHQ4H_13950 [Ktedonobacterales bacterium]